MLGAMFAWWNRWQTRKRLGPLRSHRYERFGAIVQLGRWFPRALVFVDRARARTLGLVDPPAGLWDGPEPVFGPDTRLVAPLEAHLQLTNRCAAGCAACYTAATPSGLAGEWGLEEFCLAIDELAAAGVFHVALGGGESAHLPWLGALLVHCRHRGIVPNLTTSGLYARDVLQRLCDLARQGLFGQINVSMDGTHGVYRAVRGHDGFAAADRAVVALTAAYPHVGLNTVVTRPGLLALGDLFGYARQRGVTEIEFLRLKPSGRGNRKEVLQPLGPTREQYERLLPTVLALARQHRVRARFDCSLTPFVVRHNVSPDLLRFVSIQGCAGGDYVVAARADGQMAACSFVAPVPALITELRAYLARPDAFPGFREVISAPCRSCHHQPMCRAHCRAFDETPGPGCPAYGSVA